MGILSRIHPSADITSTPTSLMCLCCPIRSRGPLPGPSCPVGARGLRRPAGGRATIRERSRRTRPMHRGGLNRLAEGGSRIGSALPPRLPSRGRTSIWQSTHCRHCGPFAAKVGTRLLAPRRQPLHAQLVGAPQDSGCNRRRTPGTSHDPSDGAHDRGDRRPQACFGLISSRNR